MTRYALIRQRHRLWLRAQGRPVNLKQHEVHAIAAELADGEPIELVAAFHGITEGRARRIAEKRRAMFTPKRGIPKLKPNERKAIEFWPG